VKAPRYETANFGDMPLLDVSASYDEASGTNAVFIVNRSQTDSLPVQLCWQDRAPRRITAVHQLSGSDPKAANMFANPNLIVPVRVAAPTVSDQGATMALPPLSFTVIEALME
jgi:alpha-N-arabinofuranosidase